MNGIVDDMVPGHRQTVYPVVESKGKMRNVTGYEKIVMLEPSCFRRMNKIMKVLDNRLIDNMHVFIPLKRNIERIGIDDENENNQTGDVTHTEL